MLTMKPLPKETVSLITSGQIITSAYSVVKELVENSLDAGAKCIEIRLDNYGLDKVEVKDDGCGLSKDEIQLMTTKDHYTSKINQFQDLTNGNLVTYGFRGEAVNAICTVSDVKIISKRPEDLTAVLIKCDDKGEPQSVSSIAGNNGTTITATDLFKKLPVRRNFMLKGNRKNDDLKKIEHLVRSYAIIVNDFRISLYHNNKMIFMKSAAKSVIDSIQKVVDTPSESFCHLNANAGNALVEIWVPKNCDNFNETTHFSEDNGRCKVYLFMNQRPVSDKKIEKVLKKYLLLAASQRPGEKQLSSIMSIKTAKNEIDVNLDPNKNTVFLVKHMDILTATEDKLREYYKCSMEDIEKKRIENSRSSVKFKAELISVDDNKESGNSLIHANTREKLGQEHMVSPFGDNSFGASLDDDFDKLFKSKQKVTLHNVSSSEQNDAKSISKFDDHSKENTPILVIDKENDLVKGQGSSIEEINEIERLPKKDTSFEQSWSRGNIFEGNEKIISPVAHYKQPKISVFSDGDEDWRNKEDSFVRPEKRAKLQLDSERKEGLDLDKPIKLDKAKRRDGAGNQTMEDLAKGPQGTPEISRSLTSKMFRNVTPVQFDMRSVTRYIQRKVEDSERKKSEPERNRRNKTEQADGPTKVLGQLNPSGYWVCSIKNGVHIVNHHKLQEVVLYKRLLQSNALPISQFAGHPLDIFEGEHAWDKRLTSTLIDMAPHHKPGSSQRFRKITDQRFTFNGFDIRVENETDRALLFGVCSSVISFMGVTDVHEILREIIKNPDVTIEDCRPQKIKTYLMGEAVRLERQTPPSVDHGQMERLLNVMTRHDLDVCLHSKPLKSNNLLKHENKRQKNMLDSLAPFIEKNNKSVPQVAKASQSTLNSDSTSVGEAPIRSRVPSYENPKAVKGVDGVIYRAAGPRGKGAKVSTVPVVAPTVVAPGCITTATLEPLPNLKQERLNVKKENNAIGLQQIKRELEKEIGTPGFGSNNGQFNSALDEIRAKFPMSGLSNSPVNNNVSKQVEKKMTDPWEIQKSKVPKPILTSPENGTKLLYDPKRRRGRPLDLPDQTIILATPKVERSPLGFR